jgi:hypothetical protein
MIDIKKLRFVLAIKILTHLLSEVIFNGKFTQLKTYFEEPTCFTRNTSLFSEPSSIGSKTMRQTLSKLLLMMSNG